MKEIDKKAVANLRYLVATTISNAKSGHTGIGLGATPMLYSLYANCMKYSPMDPTYFNRDRFVMCSGHASALQYALLHLFGFQYTMEDLKAFRKNGSITKGHPSYNPTLGIDSSSGPLGQGIPMAVGMAIAEKKLASRFNKGNFNIIDHYTYCFCGEGSLMEGITNEASSLAGTLKLNKLIVLFDSNNISIEGNTNITFTEDVLVRYSALGWNCLEVKNGDDVDAIANAIKKAKAQTEKPTIIKINTKIGKFTPLENTAKVHGVALNVDDLAKTKKNLGIDIGEFELYKDVVLNARNIVKINNDKINEEKERLKQYAYQYSDDYEELIKWLKNDYASKVDYSKMKNEGKDIATRAIGKQVLNELSKQIPNLICGSADLAPSTGTEIVGGGSFSAENPAGKNIHFGIREHAMGAICNGIALHGGFKIVCSTFMVFSDYLRHAIRMSALMKLPVIYVFSHDSIGVGEDGVTHQPIEMLPMHRATPNLITIRPADFNETVGAYKVALSVENPCVLAFSRQATKDLSDTTTTNIIPGAYNISAYKNPDAIIVGTGSELGICVEARNILQKRGIKANVVSMPSATLFDAMPEDYKQTILPNKIRNRVIVEASNADDYYKYAGLDGFVLKTNTFGYTASGGELFKEFGFTADNIANIVEKQIKK